MAGLRRRHSPDILNRCRFLYTAEEIFPGATGPAGANGLSSSTKPCRETYWPGEDPLGKTHQARRARRSSSVVDHCSSRRRHSRVRRADGRRGRRSISPFSQGGRFELCAARLGCARERRSPDHCFFDSCCDAGSGSGSAGIAAGAAWSKCETFPWRRSGSTYRSLACFAAARVWCWRRWEFMALMAYSVAQAERARSAIRMALGAQRRDVVKLVFGTRPAARGAWSLSRTWLEPSR